MNQRHIFFKPTLYGFEFATLLNHLQRLIIDFMVSSLQLCLITCKGSLLISINPRYLSLAVAFKQLIKAVLI
jgi:hypothetical protein